MTKMFSSLLFFSIFTLFLIYLCLFSYFMLVQVKRICSTRNKTITKQNETIECDHMWRKLSAWSSFSTLMGRRKRFLYFIVFCPCKKVKTVSTVKDKIEKHICDAWIDVFLKQKPFLMWQMRIWIGYNDYVDITLYLYDSIYFRFIVFNHKTNMIARHFFCFCWTKGICSLE